jgi:hypothetical protein
MALRLAFGAVLGFALAELTDSAITFFPPLLAVQFLAAMRHPPSLAQGAVLIALIALLNGFALAVAGAFAGRPVVYTLMLGLLLLFGFLLDTAGKTMPATLLLTLSATLPLMSAQSVDAAVTLAYAFVEAFIMAILIVWVVFALFPAPQSGTIRAPPVRPPAPGSALANTLAVLPVLVLFMASGQMTFVILLVIIAILRLRDQSRASRSALGLLFGNFLGGIVATIAFGFVTVQPGLVFFLLVVALVGLMFGARIATAARAPIYTIAFVTFLILLGIGVSPLPTETGEAFTSRLVDVALAGIYAVGASNLILRYQPMTW